MAVHAAGRDDLAFAGDRLRAGSDDDVDARLRVRIAGLADRDDTAVLQADIGFDDAPVVDDQRIGDDGVDRAIGARHLALAHAVADDLATAELHLVAIGGEILLHLDEQFGIGEPHLVAGGRSEHRGIGLAGHLVGHGGQAPWEREDAVFVLSRTSLPEATWASISWRSAAKGWPSQP